MNLLLLNRSIFRYVGLVFAYFLILIFCLWCAWQLRFDFSVPEASRNAIYVSLLWIVPMKLLILALTSQYSGLLSYFSVRDLARLFIGMVSSSLFVGLLWWYVVDKGNFIPPRGVILIDFVLSFMGLASIRLMVRLYREKQRDVEFAKQTNIDKVGIVGAGHSGANLVKALFIRKRLRIEPKYFFDDNIEKKNSRLHGVPILGKPELLLDKDFQHGLTKLIIALPTVSGRRVKEVVNIANQVGLTCEIVPSMEELTTGSVKISKLRKVQIQDLLQRDPVQLATHNIKNLIQGKVVMVTGAGGSIGSELCRQIANYNARRLLLIEQCESQMFVIERELIETGHENIIVSLISDILDSQRMESIFKRYKPDLVFHAAAHKHVSMMEDQPAEAFKNNTLGTIAVAEMAVRNAVSHFLLVSTDKAINPTSVMGVTKRFAEKFIQSMHSSDTQTKFMAVRFGNVLGSSGSVVTIFEKQIEEGGPVTVTHPEVTRFFMTIPESVGLILQAASQSKGGEIFVLDMGDPVKIIDLAHQLIELHGYESGTDIEVQFTSLKPGEKLFEEISHKGENLMETNHPKIMRFISKPDCYDEVSKLIHEIEKDLFNLESDQIKLKFKKFIPEYTPYLN